MTPYQIKLARHALGLPNAGKRSYRNRYFAAVGSLAEENWSDLERRGLAQRQDLDTRNTAFCLTIAGGRMALDQAEVLDPEDFPSPQVRETP